MKGVTMRATLLTAVAAGLLAAGCDDSQPTQPTRPIVVRSEVQDRLHTLDEMNLKIAMRRAIYDAGSRCQRVDDAGYVQEYGNLSMWTATCSDGYRWAVFVAPDGTAQLRRCEHVEELNLPRCEIKQRPQGGQSPQQAEPAAG
jgi:hypothetical protein